MVNCFAPNCNHCSERNSCKFAYFPKVPKQFKIWEKMVRRADRTPSKHSRLCSCHFKDGNIKSYPVFFEHNKRKHCSSFSPLKRRKLVYQVPLLDVADDTADDTADDAADGAAGGGIAAAAGGGAAAAGGAGGGSAAGGSAAGGSAAGGSAAGGSTDDDADCAADDDADSSANDDADSAADDDASNTADDVGDSADDDVAAVGTATESDAPGDFDDDIPKVNVSKLDSLIYEVEHENLTKEMDVLKAKQKYCFQKYSIHNLREEVVRMETALPTLLMFWIVVNYVKRFEDSIRYFNTWTVKSILLEDQILITLMKLKQNYTNLHLAELFHCSTATISNIVLTFIHVLHSILYDTMKLIPSKEKNAQSLPDSFKKCKNCRIVIDCTDIEMATPPQMDVQNLTYSSYRGMNSFKALIGVAPNGVITFVSNLYPGSISDKMVVLNYGLLDHLVSGDMILADKGFLIHDIVPEGVTVNIPPFLYGNKFSANEAMRTKEIAKCRIHVERANSRLKDFRILNFVPHYLRPHMDVIIQLIACIVNLQAPLIRSAKELFE